MKEFTLTLNKYPIIGSRRNEYKEPRRRCPHTSWVERMYGPEWSDPAAVYICTKEYERRRRDTRKINTVIFIVVVVIPCIIAFVVK